MTTATPDGRRLRLEVEGVDPFWVGPLPAKRGLALSEAFVSLSLGTAANGLGLVAEAGATLDRLLVEAFGHENYERLTGELRDPVTFELITAEQAGRAEQPGEPMRHEEIQAVLLASFYWQTVIGIDGVNAFLGETLPEVGALKALDLLLVRLGLSLSQTLLNSGEGRSTPSPADTSDTSTPTGGETRSVNLPARPLDRLRKTSKRRRQSSR